MPLSETILQDRYVISQKSRKLVRIASLLARLIDQTISEGVPVLVGGHITMLVVRVTRVIMRVEKVPEQNDIELDCRSKATSVNEPDDDIR